MNACSKKIINLCAISFPLLLLASFALAQNNNYKNINAYIDIGIFESKHAQPLSMKEKVVLFSAYTDMGDRQSLVKAISLAENLGDISQLDPYSRAFIAGRLGKAIGVVTANLDDELKIYDQFFFDKNTEYVKGLLVAKAYSNHGDQEKAREILNYAKALSIDEKRIKIINDLIASLDNPALRMKQLNPLIDLSYRSKRTKMSGKENIPLNKTINVIWFILMVIMAGALAKDPEVKAGWRTFWKSLFWISLSLLIIKGIFAAMHWYVYLVETFLEPFVKK